METSRSLTAFSTRAGRSGCAGEWFFWKLEGMPAGACAARSCLMYEDCRNTTSSPSTVISTLR
eukprot:4450704-Pleurochrysis_carterae.AAC.1